MKRRIGFVFLYLVVSGSLLFPSGAAADGSHGLRLSLTPPSSKHNIVRFESEHRAIESRRYWLTPAPLSDNLEAHVVYPNGTHKQLEIDSDEKGKSITINTPWGDGPSHGIHSLYVVERYVEDETLMVHVAKWITIHHSCAWGHDYKFNQERLASQSLDSIPLEITGEGLWDGNFHVRTRSAQSLRFKTLRHGKPLAGAKVSITSAQQWVKEIRSGQDGSAEFTLIEDYFPQSWDSFKRNHKSELILKAEINVEQFGVMHGVPFKRIRIFSTLPWRYNPAKHGYVSYAAGLSFGGASFLFTAMGIFIYRLKRRRPFRELVFDEKA